MNQILYIGVNLHLEVLQHFPDKHFILIDSLPLNEYGFDYYSRYYYHENFVDKLQNKFEKYGFQLINTNILTNNFEEINKKYLEATLLEYLNKTTNQIVHYYISTCIPLHLHNRNLYSSKTETIPQLLEDIKQCDSLLICGHMPHYDIYEYLTGQIGLIGYTDTIFPNLNTKLFIKSNNKSSYLEDDNKILNKLEKNKKINEYIAVNYNTGEKHIFQSYNAFYEYVSNK